LISVPVFLILAHRYELNPHAIIEQQRNLRIFKGDSAEISSRRSRLLVAFDGEVETMQSPADGIRPPGATGENGAAGIVALRESMIRSIRSPTATASFQ
jgi:hypothetical protein